MSRWTMRRGWAFAAFLLASAANAGFAGELPAQGNWELNGDISAESAQVDLEPIFASGMTVVYLHYESEIVPHSPVSEVLLSLDGGETFEPTPLFDYRSGALLDTGEEPFYTSRVLCVPQAVDEASVAFAFHVAGSDNWFWAIDNVRVTGTPDVPPGGLVRPGDSNADSNVDISDGIHLLTTLFLDQNNPQPCDGQFDEGDNRSVLNFNGDANVDISDATALFSWLFLGGDSHPLGIDCVRLEGCPDLREG